MKYLVSWLERKKSALCILIGICAMSLFVIMNSDDQIKTNTGGTYAVKIKHYGIDAAEMERSITIPMEDVFSSIPGVMSVLSSSENSLSVVVIRFKKGSSGSFLSLRKKSSNGNYEAVRDAAQRVYETLPSSVQRPEILSSNNSMVPVWSAAFTSEENDSAAQLLEKIVKPRLESLEGAGEVIVSGVGIKEIYLILDQEKLSLLGIDPSYVASVLAMNDSIYSGGSITHKNREIIISVDGRYDSLNTALIPLEDGKFIELSDFAVICEKEREPEIYSRLNGKKTAGIAVMGRHDADLRKLSAEIKKELSAQTEFARGSAQTHSLPLEFTVLSDLGAEETTAFNSVFNAALLGAIMVAIISFLLNSSNSTVNYSGFFCALAIPLICLISAAVLFIAGFSIDRLLLAGIGAGIGTAVDAVILCSEKLRKCSSYKEASAALSTLAGPLLAGAATTVAALLPLTAIDDNDAKIIASAVAVVTIVAFILSLSLLPPLLLWKYEKKKLKLKFTRFISKFKIRRIFNRTLAATIIYCVRHPIFILFIGFIISIAAIIVLSAKGADISNFGSEDSVYGQVEFDGGLLAEEVDRLLAVYSEQLLRNEEIINVETGARTGSGSLLISFDAKKTKAHHIRDLAKQIYIPGGFIFFHENTVKDRYWQIFIYGDEDQKCREIAEELAQLKHSSDHPLIKERVLNFKQGSKKLVLTPKRENFANAKINFSVATSNVRLGVYGPVAYKRINKQTKFANAETDVRIKTGSVKNTDVMRQSREGLLDLLIPFKNEDMSSSLRLNSLIETKEEREPSSIRRDNRRRYASITISTKPMDARHVKKEIYPLFSKIDLPQNYSIEFDPEAIKKSESLSASFLSLIMAVIFCYMIIASINESFTIPLLILSAIPPSLAIPAICLCISGSMYNSSIACAFIAVSGMTINAAVLCVDSIRTVIQAKNEKTVLSIYSALRRKLPALLATTATTVAGAIPFLFLTEGVNTLIRTLSLVSALGITSSFICSITIIPSLLFIFKNSLLPIRSENIPLVRNLNLNFGVKND
ncbi:MAG: efflux RND transporter permease subunit [Treponema sp.]|nr:efflux RND transporter permease subunit [Treponema sp.]MCL2250615.1 efflux RND transporter permease subunit [Treponema sp.]